MGKVFVCSVVAVERLVGLAGGTRFPVVDCVLVLVVLVTLALVEGSDRVCCEVVYVVVDTSTVECTVTVTVETCAPVNLIRKLSIT